MPKLKIRVLSKMKLENHTIQRRNTDLYPILTGTPCRLSIYITNLVCYTYFHWFFNPECQHIFGKQTGYIFLSPKTIKTWTTKHYASLNR